VQIIPKHSKIVNIGKNPKSTSINYIHNYKMLFLDTKSNK